MEAPTRSVGSWSMRRKRFEAPVQMKPQGNSLVGVAVGSICVPIHGTCTTALRMVRTTSGRLRPEKQDDNPFDKRKKREHD